MEQLKLNQKKEFRPIILIGNADLIRACQKLYLDGEITLSQFQACERRYKLCLEDQKRTRILFREVN